MNRKFLGIIGGTGAGTPELDNVAVHDTVGLTVGELAGTPILYCGRQKGRQPHNVSHVDNISQLVAAGAVAIIGLTACGSLTRMIPPGKLVVPTDFIDQTGYRESLLDNQIAHPVAVPSLDVSLIHELNYAVAKVQGRVAHAVTLVSIRGPRFATLAESRILARDAHLVNMTTAAEASVALEAGVPYAMLCTVTDYDSGAESGEEPRSFAAIQQTAVDCFPKVQEVLRIVAEGFRIE